MPDMPPGSRTDALCHLRKRLGQVDADPRAPALELGVEAIDAALGGGLAAGALHEVSPAQPFHLGAATGFALALAARARTQRRHLLWMQEGLARTEAGAPYGLGLEGFGLPMEHAIALELARADDVLWAMEEALRSRAVAAAIAELHDDAALDLAAMRRLSLAARAGGGLGLLLRHRRCAAPSAAVTRWEIAFAPGARDRFGGLGRTAFALSLTKNRHGPCGDFLVTWDHHERAFAALSLGVAEAARDRPDRAPLERAG